MDEKYYRRSAITGRTYNLFDCVKILNLKQAIFYLEHNVPLMDLQISTSQKFESSILVFVFRKRDTCGVRDLWETEKGRIYGNKDIRGQGSEN